MKGHLLLRLFQKKTCIYNNNNNNDIITSNTVFIGNLSCVNTFHQLVQWGTVHTHQTK